MKHYFVEFKTADGKHVRTLDVEAHNKNEAIEKAFIELKAILITEVVTDE